MAESTDNLDFSKVLGYGMHKLVVIGASSEDVDADWSFNVEGDEP
jgi:hypothetical protein